MIKIISVFGLMGLFVLTGCASSSYKARLDQREKQASSAGLYCEWINGDKFSDIDVEINLQMAKRCDASKPFTLTPYKNSSDANGILYCCAMAGSDSKMASNKRKSAGPAVTAPPASGGGSAPAMTNAASGSPAAAPAKDAGPAADDDIVEDK